MRGEVDLEATVAPPARRAPVGAAAQHRLHARHHLGRRGRLDDVVVGAQGQAAQLVVVLAAGAEEQQRHVGALADAPAHVEARGAGQHDVEQDAVDVVAPSAAIAPRASSAATTPKPSTARKSVSNPTISGSSSTSRTVGVLTCASVAQRPLARGGFPRIFIASSERDHARLVHSEAQRTRRESMSRFTMTLAVAAASAVAAIAAVALPAVGADSKTPRRQAKPDRASFGAFVACLRSHGLADAPADPADAQAMAGGQGGLGSRHREGRRWRRATTRCRPSTVGGAEGPDVKDVIACVRGHGVDAPTEPDAFKRWLAEGVGGLERGRRRPARLQDGAWPPDRPRARASRAAAATTCGPPTGPRSRTPPSRTASRQQGAAQPGI